MTMSVFLYVTVVTLALAVFAPNRAFFRRLFCGLVGGLAAEWLTGGRFLPFVLTQLDVGFLLTVFVVGSLTMYEQRLPVVLVLPAMALGVSAAALIRWELHLSRLAGTSLSKVLEGLFSLMEETVLVAGLVSIAFGLSVLAVREVRRTDRAAGGALAIALVVLALVFGDRLLYPLVHHWRYRGGLDPLIVMARGIRQDVAWILKGVVADGAVYLSDACVVIFLGSILSVFLSRIGLAREVVATVAELFGDDPRRLARATLITVAILFTMLSGLGSVVVVGMVAIPPLLAVEIAPEAACGILLMGISTGGLLNPSSWVEHPAVRGSGEGQVLALALPLFLAGLVMGWIFIWREVRGVRVASLGWHAREVRLPDTRKTVHSLKWLRHHLGELIAPRPHGTRPVMALIPLLPLVLNAGLGLDPVTSLIVSLLAGGALYSGPRRVDLLLASIVGGIRSVAPVAAIVIGLGMLAKAMTLPLVTDPPAVARSAVGALLTPIFTALLPRGPVSYVLLFTLGAPLALYRGPLNAAGLGQGLVSTIGSAGSLSAPLGTGMLLSVGQVQTICDPTNLANVWVGNLGRVGTRKILGRTLPYAVALAFVGLVLSAILHSGSFPSS